MISFIFSVLSTDFLLAVELKQVLDLEFMRETLESLRAIDRAIGRRPTGIGSEMDPFFQNDALLQPTHELVWKSGKGAGRMKSGAYMYSSCLGSAARGRVIRTGSRACDECQRGKGNLTDCITISGKDGPLFHGACTNCAMPNRWQGCSLVRNGPGTAVASPASFATPEAATSGVVASIEQSPSVDRSMASMSLSPSPRPRASSDPDAPTPAANRNHRRNPSEPYGSPAPVQGRLVFEHFVDPAIRLNRPYDITDCFDVDASGGIDHDLDDTVYISHYGFRTTHVGTADWSSILGMWAEYCARTRNRPGSIIQPWLERVALRGTQSRRQSGKK